MIIGVTISNLSVVLIGSALVAVPIVIYMVSGPSAFHD